MEYPFSSYWDDLEKIYNDADRWHYFSGEEGETIGVYARCSCGKFLKTGELYMNLAGEIKLKGWMCSHCGEVEPYFDRDMQLKEMK